MCEIGLLSSVPNAWEKYTIIMLYLQGGCCNTTHLYGSYFLTTPKLNYVTTTLQIIARKG
jgi:hypothetical protein